MSTKIVSGACVAALFVLLSGCGGGSAVADTGTNGGSPSGNGGPSGGTSAPIQGIATPSSVSVVTANNSN
jgi:hypothetical protein